MDPLKLPGRLQAFPNSATISTKTKIDWNSYNHIKDFANCSGIIIRRAMTNKVSFDQRSSGMAKVGYMQKLRTKSRKKT